MECNRQENSRASTGRLAELLEVSPGTVTSMLKTLSESELAQYTPYEGVQLTEAGQALALRVIRRHRLIELFLVRTLDLTWDEVHHEAENMEHAVSDRLVDRIDQFLDFPDADPHGDPIPRADGTIATAESRRLTDWEGGQQFRIVRVLDQTSDFLRYLSDQGLLLGAVGVVSNRQPHAGILTVRIGDKTTTLSREAAEKLMVEDGD
ncbi:MAG: DtxR family Mn-dependent transcriptional regulator [Pirellulaceae bacterium]|jgi:DtxR family Mn-dependent transcriptional regulator